MKPNRAEFVLSTGYTALFAVELGDDVTAAGPFLLLPVTDYDEALEALDTLERSRARKKKDPQPAPAAAAPVASGTAGRGQGGSLPPAPKCIVAGCGYDADTFAATDSDLCRDHASATDEQKAAWRALKVTPPARGKRKAAEIVQQLEDGKAQAETGSAPGPKAA